MDKYCIKVHPDVVTVPEELQRIYKEYLNNGYRIASEPFLNAFVYELEDNTQIKVYWQNGAFYEEIA